MTTQKATLDKAFYHIWLLFNANMGSLYIFSREVARSASCHPTGGMLCSQSIQRFPPMEVFMPAYFAALTMVLLIAMVLTRGLLLRRSGVEVFHFGKLDKKDFLIPPFALFYFYLIFAAAFGLPTVSTQRFFNAEGLAWAGVVLCAAGLGLLLWSLISFGQSFRVGIDSQHPDKLITSGVFAFTRNPIYVGFALVLLGQFLVFPNWLLLVYLVAGVWLFHRQVLLEEAFMQQHYGCLLYTSPSPRD